MKKSSNHERSLLPFLLLYARHYLSSGGPTSRLEESITQLGEKFGHQTEVFSTPTGVFITSQPKNKAPQTALARIRNTTINLGNLCTLERIFKDTESTHISLEEAMRILESSLLQKP